MKKILLLIALFFLSINIYAQNSNLIVGSWVFTSALNKGIDEESLASIKSDVVGKLFFNFKPDGKCKISLMGDIISGNWKFNSSSNSILVSSPGEEVMEFKILKSTQNELILKLGLGEFMLTRKD